MKQRSQQILLGAFALTLVACGGASGGSGGAGSFRILEASNGFGQLLPYQIVPLNPDGTINGTPGAATVDIRDMETLRSNLVSTPGGSNLIEPVALWNSSPVLASGMSGNHYIYVRFTQAIEIDSVLSSSVTSANGLTSNIRVVMVNPDPMVGGKEVIAGRGFINGQTYGSVDPMDPTRNVLEQWITTDSAGKPVASDARGLGFPGTEGDETGQENLVRPDTFVFVVDTSLDGLGAHDTFPAGTQILMEMGENVFSVSGRGLAEAGVATSSVDDGMGGDSIPPRILNSDVDNNPTTMASSTIIPGNGDLDQDPETNIELTFTEPVNLLTLGEFDNGGFPGASSPITIQFGPSVNVVSVPFFLEPASVFDFTRVILDPAYPFPGRPAVATASTCDDFARVDVTLNVQGSGNIQDLRGNDLAESVTTFFTTGLAPGLVNNPVLPDAIILGRRDGISVVDMNGFGQGPGSPIFDPNNHFIPGNTTFPLNLNAAIQSSVLVPPLVLGTCTFNGGSQGAFTLAVDSNLSDLVARAPLIEDVGDMALGHSLDNTFNNGAPFGCQAGGGNLCAITGLKSLAIQITGSSSVVQPSTPTNQNSGTMVSFSGGENLVSWAPHPNPPALVFPPLCSSPMIGAFEPTQAFDSNGFAVTNFLTPGASVLGNKAANMPPINIPSTEQNAFFQGPISNGTTCANFAIRQQIGNFLYVIDRSRREVVIFNSNRMFVLDRIPLSDPTSLAMAPSLDILAVTNNRSDSVSFINTDPASPLFHQVIRTERVGARPTGIAWSPDNEDILVCNQGDGSMNIISAFTLSTRKVVSNQLSSPVDVVITPRQAFQIGLNRGVYFAYIMNADGTVAVFESGPDGVNGIGFDDVVASLPFIFTNPKAIMADASQLASSFYVAHENQLDPFTGAGTGLRGGAITRVRQNSGLAFPVPLGSGALTGPSLRDIQYVVTASIGSDELTGIPVDLCFDNLKNLAGLPNISSQFSAPPVKLFNGKSIVKAGAPPRPAVGAQYIFAAIPNSNEAGGAGVVDVIDLNGFRRTDTNRFVDGIQSIPANGVTKVVDFFRQ